MLTETGRSVVAHRRGEQVTVLVSIVGTAQEGDQVVLRPIGVVVEIVLFAGGAEGGGLRVGSPVLGELLPPEVGPLITGHHVEMVGVTQVLQVLGVSRQGGIALVHLVPAFVTIVDVVRIGTGGKGGLLTGGEVSAQVQVQVQVFETVDLVVGLDAADEGVGTGLVAVQRGIQVGNRVGRGIALPGGQPGGILEFTLGPPLEVTGEIVPVGGGGVIDRLGRVHPDRIADGAGVGIGRPGHHRLSADIQRQVLVEEGRIQVQGTGDTLEVGRLEDTLLARVAEGNAVRQILQRAGEGEVVVLSEGGPVNLALPVGIGRTQGKDGGIFRSEQAADELAVLVPIEDIHALDAPGNRHGSGVAELRSLVLAAFLGRDDDDAVGSAGSVNGSRRGVLEDVEALDIGRVHQGEGVGKTFHAVVVHGQAVDDDERVVGGGQRGSAADPDVGGAARGTAVGSDGDARHLTGKHVLGVHDDTLVLGVRLERGHRTGEVVLTGGTVTDHHHVVQEFGILDEGNGGRHRRGRKGLGCITDAAHFNLRIGTRDGQEEVAVQSGGGTGGGTLFHHGGPDDGALGVDYDSFDLVSAALGGHRCGCQAGQQDSHC